MQDKKSHRPIDTTILVIDDDPSSVDLLSKMLTEHGYKVRSSTNARFDLQSALSNPPDLVLLDIRMPDMDGIALCQELKRDARTSDVPVIFISALHEIEDKVKAFEAGGADYLTKPFHDAEVLARVRTQLNLFRMQTRLEQLVQERTAELTSANKALKEEITERKQAEEALRASETKFKTIAEYSLQGIVIAKMDEVLYANPAFEEIYGYKVDELNSLSPEERVERTYPDDQEKIANYYQDLLQEKRVPASIEYRIVRKDGATRWIESRTSIIEFRGAQAFLAIFIDVTERKRAEDALRESEERLRLLVESAKDIIIMQDLDGVYLYYNAASRYGFEPEQILGKMPVDFHEPAMATQILERIKHIAASGQGLMVESSLVWQGETLWFSDQLSPIKNDAGRVVAVATISRNITEIKQAEKALRHQAFLLENVSDAIISTDVSFIVQSWNQAAKEMYGWSADEVIGKHFGEVAQPEYPDDERDEVIGQFQADGFWEGEVIHKRKDGTSIHVLGSVTLLKNDAGNPIGIVSANRDVTERKRLEKHLRQHERLAAVGQLAAGIAHDFRNLLTTVILYANMGLYTPNLPPKLARNLKTIIGESQKAADLVQQILDFSSRAMIRVQPLDLESFIEEITGILRRMIPENVHLVLDTGPEASLDSFIVKADPTRIQQALMNLATNARDAMPDGGELRFKLSRIETRPGDEPPVADMQPGEWVCLAVSDTGTGMTEDVRAHLFEPFFTTKEVGKGTGLGLAQVYGTVRQHEGYIGVETEVGVGTTFRIYLPATGAEIKVVEKKASPAPRGQGETILLVEDNEKLRQAGQGVLESLGYRVLVATNGREALEVYRMESDAHPDRRSASGGRVDLIITDIVMPEMGGKELVQELSKTDPNLKAIGVTGYAAGKVAVELSEVGFLDVVRKPFDIETLTRVIRRVLDVD